MSASKHPINFGISYLDDMMGDDPSAISEGKVVALIGEEGTHKSRLARAFLAAGLQRNGNAVLISLGAVDELHRCLLDHALESIPQLT